MNITFSFNSTQFYEFSLKYLSYFGPFHHTHGILETKLVCRFNYFKFKCSFTCKIYANIKLFYVIVYGKILHFIACFALCACKTNQDNLNKALF